MENCRPYKKSHQIGTKFALTNLLTPGRGQKSPKKDGVQFKILRILCQIILKNYHHNHESTGQLNPTHETMQTILLDIYRI